MRNGVALQTRGCTQGLLTCVEEWRNFYTIRGPCTFKDFKARKEELYHPGGLMTKRREVIIPSQPRASQNKPFFQVLKAHMCLSHISRQAALFLVHGMYNPTIIFCVIRAMSAVQQ